MLNYSNFLILVTKTAVSWSPCSRYQMLANDSLSAV